MSDRKDDPQEKDPIDALEELVKMRLQHVTKEEERKMLEKQLTYCEALRRIRAFDQERKNAPPEEKARYALLDELARIKKQRAEGRVSREEALYLIARLILPEAIRSAEAGFSSVAPSLWSAIEKVRECTISDDEYLQWEEALNKANSSFDKIERNRQKLVAGEFRLLGQRELADLYENDLPEFFRLYEEGKRIAARSTGPL